MSIIRSPRRDDDGYYLLRRSIREDRRLSWAARGMLIFLLGKPDHWKVSVENLIAETSEVSQPRRTGRDGVYAILKELELAGYITKIQGRVSGGKLGEVDYHVGEQAAPLPAQPDTAAPLPADPTLVINEGVVSIENPSKADGFDTFWQAYPKKVAKPAALRAFKTIHPDRETLVRMLARLSICKQSEQWTKSGGQFIPNPSTWLNQRRWEDEIPDGEGGGAPQFAGAL